MNNESEAEKLLTWLFNDLNSFNVKPSGSFSHLAEQTRPNKPSFSINRFDLPGSKIAKDYVSSYLESASSSLQTTPLFEPGDIPAVQDRFYALLKRKLRTEIESNPPLFPWESEMLEYEAEPTALQIWLQQLRSLNLPTTLPESVLERLLGQCQVMMQSSLREGAKLVKVVETLFPNQDQTLNDLAGWVLTAPARSPNATLPNMQDVGFPSEYDAATETQKMALSLMAAREILDALTFKLSATQPQITREWQTGAGPLCLTAEKVSAGTVMVKVALPCAGTVVFLGNDGKESIYQQTTAGDAAVTQVDLEVGQSYPLNVQLAQTDEPGLTFAIQLIGAA